MLLELKEFLMAPNGSVITNALSCRESRVSKTVIADAI